MEALPARKGAARIALIPPEVLQALNAGRIPTVNLNEFLALDLPLLARNVARDIGLDPQSERLQDTLAMLPAFAPMKRHLHVARAFHDLVLPRADRDRVAHAPLKAQPWRGLPLLEPLRADASRYVQNSVANWLNDAAKTQPAWVREVCERWSRGKAPAATLYIVRRAQRSIG